MKKRISRITTPNCLAAQMAALTPCKQRQITLAKALVMLGTMKRIPKVGARLPAGSSVANCKLLPPAAVGLEPVRGRVNQKALALTKRDHFGN